MFMNLSAKHSIGIFDSGIGGTSIWKEINRLLPDENTIYLADSRYSPYGDKSKDKIIELAVKNTEFLLNQNCKLIVVACNTVTTNAIKTLRDKYPIPFIGIEPAIKPASLKTKTNTIGILATKGTLNSYLFEKTSNNIDMKINIIVQVGEGLVKLIEKGKLYSEEMHILLQKYLQPFLESNIDCLVLGCTHYPYLIPQIKKIIGTQINIIDSGKAVAKQTKKVLENSNLLNFTNPTKHIFYSNTEIDSLSAVLSSYTNLSIEKLDF